MKLRKGDSLKGKLLTSAAEGFVQGIAFGIVIIIVFKYFVGG